MKLEAIRPWILLGYLIELSAWDFRRRAVPKAALFFGGALDLLLLAGRVAEEGGLFPALPAALLGLLPGCLLLAVAKLSGKAGAADGIALAQIGFAESYLLGFALLCTSCLLLSVCSVTLLAAKRVQKTTQMPYLPFLAAAYFLCGIWRFGGGIL